MTTLQTAGEAMEALQVLNDRVALLVAENEKLRKDAERYRWLRENGNDGWYPAYYDGYGKDRHELFVFSSERDLDKAIDAAITKELTP